jgi:hypothetical protein
MARICNAVWFFSSNALTLAPFSNSNSMTESSLLSLHEICSGVFWYLSAALISAPFSISFRTILAFPQYDAK